MERGSAEKAEPLLPAAWEPVLKTLALMLSRTPSPYPGFEKRGRGAHPASHPSRSNSLDDDSRAVQSAPCCRVMLCHGSDMSCFALLQGECSG